MLLCFLSHHFPSTLSFSVFHFNFFSLSLSISPQILLLLFKCEISKHFLTYRFAVLSHDNNFFGICVCCGGICVLSSVMSEPAFGANLESSQGEYNFIAQMHDSSKPQNESLKPFTEELLLVGRDGSFNLLSEDDTVEHLLVELEPEHNNSVYDLLDSGTFNLRTCFSTEGLSALNDSVVEANADKWNLSLLQQEKTSCTLLDERSGGLNEDLSVETSNLPDIYEDYLLDNEYQECSDFNSVPCNGYCMENVNPNHHSADLGMNQYDSKIEELSTSSELASEEIFDDSISLLDKMTTDELHVAFRKIFSRDTIVMDKQWLKRRISFGLQNVEATDNWLSLLGCHPTTNDNKVGMSIKNELLTRSSTPSTGVFNFKTKPRGSQLRRQKHTNYAYLKAFSVEVRKVVSVPDFGKWDTLITAEGGLRMSAQENIDRFVAKRFRPRRRKSEGLVEPRKGPKRHCFQERLGTAVSTCGSENKTLDGIYTWFHKQSSNEKDHEFEAYIDGGNQGSDVDYDMEFYSDESQDFSLEDSCVKSSRKRKNQDRRKYHIVWSDAEVLKLVDGVSEYGVGRWSQIKRVLFPSSPHRSAVDLKDKWRNLLKASYARPQNGGAKRGQKNKLCCIPQNILRRVRELALIFPYPRDRRPKICQNIAAATSKICF